MSLSESTVEDTALGWFLLRQGYGGQVGELGSIISSRTLATLRLKLRTGELRVPVVFATLEAAT